ncbi:MAG TPA: prolyl-tRNA synthetase associated domain-containing protein [Clostridiaceae bacterium]|nr:prolyl-tRNA synthetase associated domain-containing protein [Clostridiaceae bacterium]
MERQEAVYRKLEEMDIPYEVEHHNAVFTIEEMEELGLPFQEDVVKNLFLRDDKGKEYYLVVLMKDKKSDLKALRHAIGSRPLSFASEERLEKVLKLEKGAVTPFGILNDEDVKVTVVFDRDLREKEKVAVHPNDNRATAWLRLADLVRMIEENGNRVLYAEI